MQQGVLLSCFDGWFAYHERCRLLLARAAFAMGPGRMLATSFRTWYAYLREVQRGRQLEWLQESLETIGQDWLQHALGNVLSPLVAPPGSSAAIVSKYNEELERLVQGDGGQPLRARGVGGGGSDAAGASGFEPRPPSERGGSPGSQRVRLATREDEELAEAEAEAEATGE